MAIWHATDETQTPAEKTKLKSQQRPPKRVPDLQSHLFFARLKII